MTKLKSPRKRRRAWWVPIGKRHQRPKYEAFLVLHEYEEWVVLRSMVKGDGHGSTDWVRLEPGRWVSQKALGDIFRRLEKRGLVVPAIVRRENYVVQVGGWMLAPVVQRLLGDGNDLKAFVDGNALACRPQRPWGRWGSWKTSWLPQGVPSV